MSKEIWTFGNLNDIISAKRLIISLLLKETHVIEDEFVDDLLCGIFCKQHHCNGCPQDEVCNAKIKILQEKIAELKKEIELLEQEIQYIKSKSLP